MDYTVQRSDDEAVENLRSPKRVDLERSLSTVGKTLYSKAPAPPPEEVRHWFYIQHVTIGYGYKVRFVWSYMYILEELMYTGIYYISQFLYQPCVTDFFFKVVVYYIRNNIKNKTLKFIICNLFNLSINVNTAIMQFYGH